jgi:uncharacterized peroxidase-related enzyme
MPFIETIEPEYDSGELKEIYVDLISSRGIYAEVHKIQAINPKSIVNHMDLYMTIMFGKSPLKRVLREMMAVVVSINNNCLYCTVHHAHAVAHYWKNDEKISQLKKDYSKADLTDVELALCDFAKDLTVNPSQKESHVVKLKLLGLEDRAILDATLVISYFNFVNRIVLSLGIALENDGGGGYSYE